MNGTPALGQLRFLAFASAAIALFAVFLSFTRFHSMFGLIFVISGIAVGAIVGYVFEKKELRALEEKGESKITLKELLWILGVVAIFPVLFYFGNFLPWRFEFFSAVQSLAFSSCLGFVEGEIFVVKKWQRKNNRRVMFGTGWFLRRVYANPPMVNQA